MLQTLHELLNQEPFVPFELSVSSGDKFKIENPGLVTFVRDHLVYYMPRSDGRLYVRLSQLVWMRSE